MIFHSNTPTGEVIKWLREKSITGGMSPAFIDKLDELTTVEDLEAEIEKLGGLVSDLEKDKDDLIGELTDLRVAFVTFLDGGDPDDKDDRRSADNAVETAQCAIARHTA